MQRTRHAVVWPLRTRTAKMSYEKPVRLRNRGKAAAVERGGAMFAQRRQVLCGAITLVRSQP